MTKPAWRGITSVSLWFTRIATGRFSYTGASVSATVRLASIGPRPPTATPAIAASSGNRSGAAAETAGAVTAATVAMVATRRRISTDARSDLLFGRPFAMTLVARSVHPRAHRYDPRPRWAP